MCFMSTGIHMQTLELTLEDMLNANMKNIEVIQLSILIPITNFFVLLEQLGKTNSKTCVTPDLKLATISAMYFL